METRMVIFEIDENGFVTDSEEYGINIYLDGYPAEKPEDEIINGLVIQVMANSAGLWNTEGFECDGFYNLLFHLPDVLEYANMLDFKDKDSFEKVHGYCNRRFIEIMSAIRPDLYHNVAAKSSRN